MADGYFSSPSHIESKNKEKITDYRGCARHKLGHRIMTLLIVIIAASAIAAILGFFGSSEI